MTVLKCTSDNAINVMLSLRIVGMVVVIGRGDRYV